VQTNPQLFYYLLREEGCQEVTSDKRFELIHIEHTFKI
jgi:hypothetical protein